MDRRRETQRTLERTDNAGWKLELEEVNFAGCLINGNTNAMGQPPLRGVDRKALVEMMAAGSGLTKTECGKALNAFVAAVQTTLTHRKKVTLAGVGTFSAAPPSSKGRLGVVRQKNVGAAPPVVEFRPSKALLDAVAG